MVKTAKGFVNRELYEDGRESGERWSERETCQREQTKTKLKRSKKADDELIDFALNS